MNYYKIPSAMNDNIHYICKVDKKVNLVWVWSVYKKWVRIHNIKSEYISSFHEEITEKEAFIEIL